MYQSESFFVEAQNDKTRFSPSITSAYQILADKSYYHICDENEKERYLVKLLMNYEETEEYGEEMKELLLWGLREDKVWEVN